MGLSGVDGGLLEASRARAASRRVSVQYNHAGRASGLGYFGVKCQHKVFLSEHVLLGGCWDY